jgi:nitric oxide reductase large subunit
MKKLYYAALVYLVVGLASGLGYREFTKLNDYTAADGFTQLSVVHTHLLTLGVIVLLIVLVLEKVFELSKSKLFGWFFWLYNIGLVVTAALMTVNGILHVLDLETSKALAGISGSGHIIMSAGLVLLFIALGKRISARPAPVTAE